MKFEEAMRQLETLVEQIESGEVGLEEALKQYERGVALISRCRKILGAAEQRIAELTTDENGELAIEGEPGPDESDEAEPEA